MKRTSNSHVVAKFNKLDFHDDVFLSLKVYPSVSRTNVTRIDLEFRDDSTKEVKVLSFHRCANFRFVMDFDVLADNCYFGTEASAAKNDVQQMRKFVKAQMSHWRTEYMRPLPEDKPIRRKLRAIGSYIFFQVTFFGGTAEVLAKYYRLKR
jgi:hypothetical protein